MYIVANSEALRMRRNEAHRRRIVGSEHLFHDDDVVPAISEVILIAELASGSDDIAEYCLVFTQGVAEVIGAFQRVLLSLDRRPVQCPPTWPARSLQEGPGDG
jgi:hypothetical protein